MVVNQNMSEEIIERPLIKTLGFYFYEHLRSIRHNIDGKSVSEIRKAKQASLTYNGVKYSDCGEKQWSFPIV